MVSHPEEFKEYWYSGNAELNYYVTSQKRYGEPRSGSVTMIFVTEDFNTTDQVKWEGSGKPKTSVLKLNKINRFQTGIYDYSIMNSVFTPVRYRESPLSLKITMSSQDWCGQSFRQMNYQGGKLSFQIRSYFENEGDQNFELDPTYLEDDIWNRIRIEPQMLPLGKIDMIPSLSYLSLNHSETKPYPAIATLVLQVNDSKENNEFYIYKLEYPDLDRALIIECQSRFPFKILGWKELSIETGEVLTTARLENTEILPYWNLNSKGDSKYRDELFQKN
jgi:hypothetical protein